MQGSPDKRTPMQKLWDDLRYFDWYHEYSDDLAVAQRGRAREAELRKTAESLPGGLEMFQAMRKHFFSGAAYSTPVAPVPARPVEEAA